MGTDRHSTPGATSRPDRLGVRRGQSILLVGVTDARFIAELQARGARITRPGPADAIFCAIESRAALQRLPELVRRMKRTGALWTIRPTRSALVSDDDLVTAARAAGLEDVKMVRFSETHAARKFVIPAKDRG